MFFEKDKFEMACAIVQAMCDFKGLILILRASNGVIVKCPPDANNYKYKFQRRLGLKPYMEEEDNENKY